MYTYIINMIIIDSYVIYEKYVNIYNKNIHIC